MSIGQNLGYIQDSIKAKISHVLKKKIYIVSIKNLELSKNEFSKSQNHFIERMLTGLHKSAESTIQNLSIYRVELLPNDELYINIPQYLSTKLEPKDYIDNRRLIDNFDKIFPGVLKNLTHTYRSSRLEMIEIIQESFYKKIHLEFEQEVERRTKNIKKIMSALSRYDILKTGTSFVKSLSLYTKSVIPFHKEIEDTSAWGKQCILENQVPEAEIQSVVNEVGRKVLSMQLLSAQQKVSYRYIDEFEKKLISMMETYFIKVENDLNAILDTFKNYNGENIDKLTTITLSHLKQFETISLNISDGRINGKVINSKKTQKVIQRYSLHYQKMKKELELLEEYPTIKASWTTDSTDMKEIEAIITRPSAYLNKPALLRQNYCQQKLDNKISQLPNFKFTKIKDLSSSLINKQKELKTKLRAQVKSQEVELKKEFSDSFNFSILDKSQSIESTKDLSEKCSKYSFFLPRLKNVNNYIKDSLEIKLAFNKQQESMGSIYKYLNSRGLKPIVKTEHLDCPILEYKNKYTNISDAQINARTYADIVLKLRAYEEKIDVIAQSMRPQDQIADESFILEM